MNIYEGTNSTFLLWREGRLAMDDKAAPICAFENLEL